MKKARQPFIVILLLLGSCPAVFSQNQTPVVEIDQVELTPQTATITIGYSLSDAEGDTCTVRAFISEDKGTTFSAFAFSQTGDLGTQIGPGAGKSISLYPVLSPDSMIRIKIVAYDDTQEDLSNWVAQVDTNRMKSDLAFIAQERNHLVSSAQLDQIRDSLGTRMQEVGLHTVFQPVPYGGYTGANVNGSLAGLEIDSSVVIVDAHFDGVPGTPGANDNGIAVVALLEVARILSAGHYQRSLEFLAFDLEEYGLIGSQEYIQRFDNAGKSIVGVLNMEMIGYFTEAANTQEFPPGFAQLFPAVYQTSQADSFRGNFLANVANTASIPLQEVFDSLAAVHAPALKVYSVAVPGTGTIAPDFRRSDHASFWDASISALMLTGGGDLRDSAYHTGSDSLSRISIGKVELVTKAMVATAAHLAGPLHAGEDVSGILTVSRIDKILDKRIVTLYPNPVSGLLHLRSDHLIRSVRILDLQGKELLRQSPNRPEVQVSCENFPPGIYVIIAETPNGQWNSSWIKE